jgi:predicted acylesterase/phospholipase RssA
MSASVPIYFNQMIHHGELFTDGGVVENFPLYPSDDVDDTLGIYIQPVHNSAACDTLLGYVHQVAMVAYRERLAQKVASIHNASCINIPTTTKGFEFINAVKTILDNISDGYSAAGDPKNRNFLLV